MAKDFEMDLSGFDLIEEILNEIDAKERANIYRTINKQLLKDNLLNELKEAAPDEHISNATKLINSNKDKTGVLVGIDPKGSKGTDVIKARFLEYGTEQRQTDDGANRGTLQAQPFFRPALKANQEKLLKAIETDYAEFANEIIEKKIKSTQKKIQKLI